MSDLVQRLRNHALPDPYDEREVMHAPLLREAADTIESLQAENAKLRALIEQMKEVLADERYVSRYSHVVEALAAYEEFNK